MGSLILILLLIIAFYGGVVLGIHDCKKRYNLPKEKRASKSTEDNTKVVEDDNNN